MRRRNVAADEGASAKRAAPPVGSTWLEPGHVVAERRAGAARPRTRSPRACTRSASASASSPDQLEVLGRDLARPAQRRRRASAASTAQLRVGRRWAAPAPGARPRPRPRRAAPASGEITPERAVLAVLGLGEQVERDQLGVGVVGGHHDQLARARPAPSMPTVADHLALGLLDLAVARARRSRPRRGTDSVP